MNPINKPKPRPAASCAPCRNRKVKCDRLSPCEACVARGIPHECKYAITDEDREAIAQAEVIAQLRGKSQRLRSDLAAAEAERQELRRRDRDYHHSRSEDAAMEMLYSALRLGSQDLVERLVGRIREGEALADVIREVQTEGMVHRPKVGR
ncbi:hypothetical protein EYZ11_007502 [Aspergillus tanneri]|uniref:Zn(2)-C6 fungal-type domain-containing protein n=1 Tax=Aspergillus tanneri TaxID=1220188 RepID=A0A4S3JD19_9EURO|nr:uncharacterized protein ATNIH1004_004269 [Aspergillus tanneri]KAA8648384.1 hypothetical protein ATNIH1004_004269 [Aspergillus tanneri]THC93020.1 hypothetical protein EYZ11_007502 [Aspergillus tanneri]